MPDVFSQLCVGATGLDERKKYEFPLDQRSDIEPALTGRHFDRLISNPCNLFRIPPMSLPEFSKLFNESRFLLAGL